MRKLLFILPFLFLIGAGMAAEKPETIETPNGVCSISNLMEYDLNETLHNPQLKDVKVKVRLKDELVTQFLAATGDDSFVKEKGVKDIVMWVKDGMVFIQLYSLDGHCQVANAMVPEFMVDQILVQIRPEVTN